MAAIRNILTLRYNPEPPRKGLTERDFMVHKVEFDREYLEELLKLVISEAIERQQPEHIVIPCGSGVDSTLMMALTKEVYKGKITAISMGFNDCRDETAHAKKICDALDVDLRTAQIDNPLQQLPTMISIAKEPRFNLYWYYVVHMAKRLGGDMMLTGDGGDEVFAGYTFRYEKILKLLKAGCDPVTAYLEGHSRDWVPDQEQMFAPEMRFSWSKIHNLLYQFFDNDLHPLNQVLMADYDGKLLYDYLPTNQAFYNYFKMPNVAPMLDRRVISYALRLPISRKYNGTGKLPLWAILESKKLSELVPKEKSGFGFDVVNVWKRHGSRSFDHIVEQKIINREWLEPAMQKADSDPRYAGKMLMLHALEVYLTQTHQIAQTYTY